MTNRVPLVTPINRRITAELAILRKLSLESRIDRVISIPTAVVRRIHLLTYFSVEKKL